MYKYYCEKCKGEFETRKKEQRYCSKSCANSASSIKRKIEARSIFEQGLNEISAYILGIIISDGCLSYDNHSNRYRITISMNDFELVEYLRKTYSPDKKLYKYVNPKSINATYTFISSNMYDINFIKGLGINERKSLEVLLPQIEAKYMRHVIRGIFDGDGSVYVNKTTSNGKQYEYVNASFTTGSEEFAENILSVLKSNCINAHKVKDLRQGKNCWYVKVYAKSDVEKFYQYLYNGATLFLERKKNLFI